MKIDHKTEILRQMTQEQLTKTTKEKELEQNKSLEKTEDVKKNNAYDVSLSKEAMDEVTKNLQSKREFEVNKIKQAMTLVNEDIDEAKRISGHGLTMKSLDLVI
ncbi:MAG: hypothetical protein GY714_27215 [Desulfobacterales bacterium]|nr:hypothetical protein [Desulfobacterales bacterium]MCP4160758.1 hypothetical protein [Deltaproteobacteria bacterium]